MKKITEAAVQNRAVPLPVCLSREPHSRQVDTVLDSGMPVTRTNSMVDHDPCNFELPPSLPMSYTLVSQRRLVEALSAPLSTRFKASRRVQD